MLKPKTWLRIVLVVLIGAALAYAGWRFTRPQPPEVEFATIARGPVEATVVNTRAGTVKACRRAKLAPVAGGQIVKLWVKEGDRVKAGQPLLELWNHDLAAQRELATRQLTTSEERRREACIMADNARRDADRTQQLAARGFVSPQSGENARAEARARQANCDALAADVKRAQAQIRVTLAGLERTTLTAPFAGIVAQVTGEVGEYTTPSPPGIPTPPAVDLIDDTCLYVSAPMDEVDAPKLKAGQPARITLDALPGQTFSGKVRRIAPYVTEVEKQARTVDVEVDFDTPPTANPAGRLQCRCRSHHRTPRRRAARAHPGDPAGRHGAGAGPRRQAGSAQPEDRAGQLGVHRNRQRAERRRPGAAVLR